MKNILLEAAELTPMYQVNKKYLRLIFSVFSLGLSVFPYNFIHLFLIYIDAYSLFANFNTFYRAA